MANGFPSLEELIKARRTGGAGEAIQSGLEGFLAGRKRRQEEETARVESVLAQAKQRLSEQAEARNLRTTEAGLIPPAKSLTGKETSPEVQKVLTPPAKEFVKAGESEEGGKKFILFSEKDKPSNVIRVPAGEADQKGGAKGPAGQLISAALKRAGSEGFIKEIENIMPKLAKASGEGLVGGARALGSAIQVGARGFLGGDPDVIAFQQARQTAGRSLYKELSGDVGNISQSEGQFAADLIPSVTDSVGVQNQKLERLKRLKEASRQALQEIEARIKSGNLTAEEAEATVKSTILGLMQQAVSVPVGEESQAAGTEPPPQGGLSPEKQRRLAELRAKRDAGTLGR